MTLNDLLKVLSLSEKVTIVQDSDYVFDGHVSDFNLPIKHFTVQTVVSVLTDTTEGCGMLIFVENQ